VEVRWKKEDEKESEEYRERGIEEVEAVEGEERRGEEASREEERGEREGEEREGEGEGEGEGWGERRRLSLANGDFVRKRRGGGREEDR
jgi:hypothetical protein